MVETPSLRDLLQAGVHFGHKTSRWHPNMAKYIFTAKSGVHVINLEATAEKLAEAVEFVKQASLSNKTVLFVGTKKQASSIVKEAALNCGMPYVNFRWIGGVLTNFDVVKGSIKKLQQNKKLIETEEGSSLSKRDRTKLRDEVEKGEKIFGGLVGLEKRPDVMVLIGAHDEKNALREAKMLKIPTIAIVDTNTDPTTIDYPIPANDDATKSIQLITKVISDTIKANKTKAVEKDAEKK